MFSAPTDGRMDDSPSHPATVTRQFSLQRPTAFPLPSYQTHLSGDILSGVARGWGVGLVSIIYGRESNETFPSHDGQTECRRVRVWAGKEWRAM